MKRDLPQASLNFAPHLQIEITKYRRTRFYAIHLNGNLLAVTVYKKGAMAIRDVLQSQHIDAKP